MEEKIIDYDFILNVYIKELIIKYDLKEEDLEKIVKLYMQ